ncbi:MAG: lipid II flippase MurJ, partial [Paraclostridium sp.]
MSKVAKNTIMIMAITMLCKLIGFGREIALGSIYGFSNYGGIYLAVVNIPDIIFALVGTCIMTTFIPLHYDIEREKGLIRAKEFLNNVSTITIIMSIIIAIVSLIFTEDIVKLFAMGLEGENLEIATKFTKILIPGGFFISISGIISAYLNINDDFISSTFVSIPFNIIVITTII